MHKVQHGVFGFMTPAVSTFRMNPAISAWAAVNSRLPQSAERTINELWAHRRGRAAQPQCRVSAIAKGVAVTVERARRRDGVADTIAASPAKAVPALSRNNCMNKLQGGRCFGPDMFCRCSAFGHASLIVKRSRTELAVSPAVMLASAHHLALFQCGCVRGRSTRPDRPVQRLPAGS